MAVSIVRTDYDNAWVQRVFDRNHFFSKPNSYIHVHITPCLCDRKSTWTDDRFQFNSGAFTYCHYHTIPYRTPRSNIVSIDEAVRNRNFATVRDNTTTVTYEQTVIVHASA